MRLCRFLADETPLVGFYLDDFVVPFDLAADAAGLDVDLSHGEDLLAYLPPDGPLAEVARALDLWLSQLARDELAAIAHPVAETRLLVPVARPPKLLLLAGNYPKHVEERGGSAAERASTFPYVFTKPLTTLTHPGDPIRIPSLSPGAIDWECELGVIVGRRARALSEAEALECVAGYTVVNDVSDRRFRPNPGRTARPRDEHFDWLHGKWHDTFCPIGPCVLASEGAEAADFRLSLRVNGALMQDADTSQMVFPVAAILSFISSFVTLEPGDVIATGTPAGVGASRGIFLKPGDQVEAAIEGIGVLRNGVVAES